MKTIFSLAFLFLSISLLLLHTESFTSAEIRNKAVMAIVAEDHALLAISYVKGNGFLVTNNTGRKIELDRVELMNSPDHKIVQTEKNDSFSINQGGVKEFTVTGDPKDLTGEVIFIMAHWDGGSAKIKSTIPELIGQQ